MHFMLCLIYHTVVCCCFLLLCPKYKQKKYMEFFSLHTISAWKHGILTCTRQTDERRNFNDDMMKEYK